MNVGQIGRIIALLVVLLAPVASRAATFAVTSDLDDGSVGTLRWAIGQANGAAGADIITIPAITITLTSALPNITQSVTIEGSGRTATIVQAGVTYRDGNVLWRVLTTTGAGTTLTLRDLTVRHGRSSGGSGGILSDGPLVLERVSVSHNIGETSTFGFGGGIIVLGNLTATDSEITHNTVENTSTTSGGVQAGGIYMPIAGTTATFTGCTIANNTATTFGVGTAEGGGIVLSGAGAGVTCTLTRCTISANLARSETFGSGSARGGGLFIAGSASTVAFDACTITANKATGFSASGGGIYSSYTADNTGPVIHNTILAGNAAGTGPDFFNRVQSRGFNIVGNTAGGTLDDTGGANTATGNQVGAAPALFALGDNGGATRTHLPKPGSIALNAGTDLDLGGSPLATDQRGRARVSGGTADVGAVELDEIAPTVTGGIALDPTTTTDRDTVVFHVTFSEALAAALTPSNVTLTGTLAGAATASVRGANPAFDVVVTMNNQYADGTIGIDLAGTMTDLEGNSLALPVSSALYTIRNVPGDTNDDGDVVAAELNTVVLWFRDLLP